MKEIAFAELLNKTLTSIEGAIAGTGSEKIIFRTSEGEIFALFYEHDCCATCSVEDVCGDVSDLIGYPLLLVAEESSKKHPEGIKASKYEESFTWTFYKLATIKGSVTIRWFGESNGYYSESVSFVKIENDNRYLIR